MTLFKNLFLALFLLLTSIPSYAETLPKNITDQLPKGFEVMTFMHGNLNDDKLADYLVVVHIKNEDAIYEKTQGVTSRPLFIFIQNPNATYSPARRNDKVVFTIDSGGQCDPFLTGQDGLAIKHHYFTVQNGVSCSEHWNDFITFHYDTKLKDWFFHKRVFESWSLNNSDDPNADGLIANKPKVTSTDVKHPILFEKYKP